MSRDNRRLHKSAHQSLSFSGPRKLSSSKTSKSDERFTNQYQHAPRKIFMRPPCEHEEPSEDLTDSVIAACGHATYVLSDRFYDELVRRQLVAVDEVVRLQGDRGLRITQLHSFSELLQVGAELMIFYSKHFTLWLQTNVILCHVL